MLRKIRRKEREKCQFVTISLTDQPSSTFHELKMKPSSTSDGTFHSRVRVRLHRLKSWQPFPTARCLLHSLVYPPPVSRPHRYHPGMGQHPWATSEQLVFLKSFTHLLPQAKGTTGLGTLHTQVYDAFLLKWDAEPITLAPDPPLTPEQLETWANARLLRVSVMSNSLYLCLTNLPAHQELVQ